jgi:hypothetical protein
LPARLEVALGRPETTGTVTSKFPQLRAKGLHFQQARVVGGNKPLLELKQLPRAAMVERLHPPRLQVHLDPVL